MKYTLVAPSEQGTYRLKLKSHHHISVGDQVLMPHSGNTYEVLSKTIMGDECYLGTHPPGSESAYQDGWNEPR